MTKYNVKPLGLKDFFDAGYVCPETGRVAVLVKDFARSRLNGYVMAYYYDKENAYFGLDEWRDVEGIDTLNTNTYYDLWFARGHEKTVSGDSTIFLRAFHAQRLKEMLDSED